ncbi:MAG TPA: peptidoglycan DD-metalloendopeptidase family protein [Eubacteriaceae bacterium]|nr:peptidoglycan DD-metalloendopeptidase family protein [Eubacteriaceae bacterium]
MDNKLEDFKEVLKIIGSKIRNSSLEFLKNLFKKVRIILTNSSRKIIKEVTAKGRIILGKTQKSILPRFKSIKYVSNKNILRASKSIKLHINSLKQYIIAKKLKVVISSTIIIVMAILAIGIYQGGNGYKLSFNGQELGLIKNEKVFAKVLDQVCKEVASSKGERISFDKEYSLEKVKIGKEKPLDEDHLKVAIYNNIDYKIKAAIIKVNGEEVVVLQNRDQAEKVLEELKAPYTDSKDNVVIKRIGFSDKVEIIEGEVKLDRLVSQEEALLYLQQGTDQLEQYEVVSGDNCWDISRSFGVNLRDMEAANPGKDLNRLYPGDVINLTMAKPFINVETIEEKIYTEKIPYKTTYKDDKSIYKGKQKVITAGKYGTREVKAEVAYINGSEVSRTILEEKILKEPTTQVIAKGTKPLPPPQGSGAFRRPASGRTGSYGRFGAPRPGGRKHAGIDIGNKRGTAIYAADGGTVTSYIGYRGGYGYIVEINHGRGYTTRYAHLSKILVSAGQRVAKGDLIGRMGSTGNSTGPHLHFEIRKNGTPLNPFRFIK